MDGTFFDFPACERCAFFRTVQAFGIAGDETMYQRYHAINAAVWRELEQGDMTHEQLRPERFRRLLAQPEWDFLNASPEEMARINLQCVSEGAFLYDGARALWERIYAQYIVCVLTNGSDYTQLGRLERAGLLPYTHAVVTSQRAGIGKPDAGIFRYALDVLGCTDKRQCVMIGDSLSADIFGAHSFGIDAIWYHSGELLEEIPSDILHAETYRQLADILAIIK